MNIKDGRIWLVFIFLWIVVFINPVGDFPINDDWRYSYPVKSLLETGEIQFGRDFAPTLLLQIVWGYVFCLIGGFSFTTLRISTLVLAIVGLLALCIFVRKTNPNKDVAFSTSLLMLFSPFFLSNAFSFMTDVPFLSLTVISLYFLYLYFENQNKLQLAFALLFSAFACLIRQPGILIPISITIVLAATDFNRHKQTILAISIYIILTILGVELLKYALGLQGKYVKVYDEYLDILIHRPAYGVEEIARKFSKMIVYFGLFGIPVLILLEKKLRHYVVKNIILSLSFIVAALIFTFVSYKAGKLFPFGGNSLYNLGIGPLHIMQPKIYEPTLSTPSLIFVTFLGFVLGLFLIMILYLDIKKQPKPFQLVLVVFCCIYMMAMSVTSFFDRYMLVPLVCFYLLTSFSITETRPIHWIATYLLICALAFFTVLGTKDFFDFQKAKLASFDWLMNQNVSIKEMDAGLELNSLHNFHPDFLDIPSKSWWYVNDDKYVITNCELPSYKAIHQVNYFSLYHFKSKPVFVLKRED